MFLAFTKNGAASPKSEKVLREPLEVQTDDRGDFVRVPVEAIDGALVIAHAAGELHQARTATDALRLIQPEVKVYLLDDEPGGRHHTRG